MKVNIFTIPDEGLNVDFPFAEETFLSLLPQDAFVDFTFRSAYVHGSIRKTGNNLFFRGNVVAILDTVCSRCLEEIHLPIKADFNYTLLPELLVVPDELELKAEDLEVSYYKGDVIDLDPMIMEQLLLQVPMKVLCQDECRGLCPTCGTNLNTGSCQCRGEYVDERLLILKKFMKSE